MEKWNIYCGVSTLLSLVILLALKVYFKWHPSFHFINICLEKAMAPHSSTLAWKIPWMEEPGGLQSMGSLESDRTERLHFHFLLSCIGEGNGNPPQCSSLENPRDEGAWWAAVYGVTQSWTRLKWLSSSRSSSNDSNGLCFWLLRRTFNALFWHAW